MKFTSSILLALAAVSSVSGFAPSSGKATTSTALKSSYAPGGEASWQMPPAAAGPSGDFFPLDIPMKRIEGGGSVRTWDIPPETERLQYVVETNGRPLKAKVEL